MTLLLIAGLFALVIIVVVALYTATICHAVTVFLKSLLSPILYGDDGAEDDVDGEGL